jgi:serine/threonine protein phosphatase PrpC
VQIVERSRRARPAAHLALRRALTLDPSATQKKKSAAAAAGSADAAAQEEAAAEEEDDDDEAAPHEAPPPAAEAAVAPAPAPAPAAPAAPREKPAPPAPAPRGPAGATSLGAELPRRALSGPHLRHALSKERVPGKGEDQWLVRPHNAWTLPGPNTDPTPTPDPDANAVAGQGAAAPAAAAAAPASGPAASFAAFGIFDGHGGRQAATFASNALLKYLAAALDDPALPAPGAPLAPGDLPPVEGLPAEDVGEWLAQAELARRLPAALAAAFLRCDAEAQARFPRGGTTATLAVQAGWELLVASVGDSLAFLDTGAEVLAVSGNHRLDDSPSERARIVAEGGEVEASRIEGVPAGPLRVWPGGLAMSRTVGDAEAGPRAAADPEVCQLTLPPRGGRLLIGSDGLWDAVQPKTAAHHVRGMGAAEAAHCLVAMAVKKDKLRDDVTAVVVDFVPGVEDRAPPALAAHRAAGRKGGGGGGGGVPAAATGGVRVWHPRRETGAPLAAGAERESGRGCHVVCCAALRCAALRCAALRCAPPCMFPA